MTTEKKCVVISVGSHRTVAGFNNVDLPQCCIPSSYLRVKPEEDVEMEDGDAQEHNYVFGTFEMIDGVQEALKKQDNNTEESKCDVFTIVDSQGLPYNWQAMEMLFRHIYDKELKVDPSELPLVITLPSMTNREIETKIVENYMELAFEKLKVPVLQIVVEPLGTMLSTGKSSSLVIDIGASGCTITPIIDGTILRNCIVKSRYAGDFLDFQVSKKLEELKNKINKNDDNEDIMGTEAEQNSEQQLSSLEVWLNANTSIHEFKSTMLSLFDKDLKEVEKYYEEQMKLYKQQQEKLAEQQNNPQAQHLQQYTIPMNNPNINNPLVQRLNYLLRYNQHSRKIQRTVELENKELLEISEYLFQPRLASEQFSNKDGLGELIGKAIKKSGASVNANSTATGNNTTNGGTNTAPSNATNSNNSASSGPLFLLNGYSSIGLGSSTGAPGAGDAASSTNITPEHVYSLLLTNVIITGGTSLIEGMEQRIIRELSVRFPQYKLSTFSNPDQLQRSIQAWNGAVSLSNLPKWELTQWYTKEDYNNHKLKKDEI
ncbi:Uncharacterized protein RNJ44_02822 [Nakaseomyces bracarensis]|uniref:Actin-related protein 7 n=1 Tax=Nakaseomyces bracarensis TaxID=273131 RepID=A0ABR4P0B5_9SACH